MNANDRVPLMEQLAECRRGLRTRRYEMAAHLGVALTTVTGWERGYNSPTFRHVLGYARHVGCRMVLRDGLHTVAEGWAIPRALPLQRIEAGLTQTDLGRILHIGKAAVANSEMRGYSVLASIEACAKGLDLIVAVEKRAKVLIDA